MVNVNELKIGEFYKFIIEEVVDEEKKIVDVMEIVGYYTGQVIIEDKQILIVNIPKTIVDSVAYLDTRTYVLYIFNNCKHITLFVFCVEFSPYMGYNNNKKTAVFS